MVPNGTNGITNGTIGRTLNNIGLPLVPISNNLEGAHCHFSVSPVNYSDSDSDIDPFCTVLPCSVLQYSAPFCALLHTVL